VLREQEYIFRRANQLTDFALAVGALWLGHGLTQHIARPYLFPLLVQKSDLFTHGWVFVAFPLLFVAAQVWNDSYHSLEFRREGRTYLRNLASVVGAVVATWLVAAARPELSVSRASILGAGAVLGVLTVGKVAAVRALLIRAKKSGKMARRLIVVGSGEPIDRFLRQVHDHPVWGFAVMGIVSDGGPAPSLASLPPLGNLEDLPGILDKHHPDEVIFVPSEATPATLAPHLSTCELMGLRARLVLNAHRPELPLSRYQADLFDGTPLVTLAPSWEVTDWRLLVKYGADRVLALVAIVLLSPVLVGIALAIKLTSPRGAPILYAQERCGLNGKLFRVLKFRSMHVNADAMLEKLREQNEMSGPVFKMKHDPRVTPLGRFLRKTSLDELPQFFNVLMGQMSLVGPRPPIPAEVAKYDRRQRRRLSMKPGITCLWQVSGRNLLDFETWMRLDLEYIDTWSLWLDAKILARTVRVVLTGYGAM